MPLRHGDRVRERVLGCIGEVGCIEDPAKTIALECSNIGPGDHYRAHHLAQYALGRRSPDELAQTSRCMRRNHDEVNIPLRDQF
jgi:hypothetical protein